MRNFCLLVLFLAIGAFTYAQNYSLRIYGRVNHEGDKCDDTEMRFYVYYESEDEPELITTAIDANYNETIVRNKKMVRVETDSYRKVLKGVGVCRFSGNGRLSKFFDGSRCFNQKYIQGENDAENIFKPKFNGSLTIEYQPIIGVDNSLDGEPIGYDSEYNLYADPGFQANNYNWQYQFYANGTDPNPSKWKNLPRPSTPHNLKFTPEDYLTGSEFDKYDDWSVSFRLNQCNLDNGSEEFHRIKYSAPRFVSIVEDESVTCFGGKDGGVTFKVNRQLRSGEKLTLKILDLDEDSDGENSVGEINDVIIGPDLKIKVDSLPASEGLEGFRAAFFTGNTQFTGDLDHIQNFRIEGPDFVKFEVTNNTDVNCHAGEDGTISLKAEGGNITGTYEFVIYEDAMKESIPDSDWESFSNTDTHLETGLKKGTYFIAVRDANGCLAEDWVDNVTSGKYDNNGLVIEEIIIDEPAAPLLVEFLEVTPERESKSNNARAHNFTDGRIVAVVSGGTGPYSYTWSKEGETIRREANVTTSGLIADDNYVESAILDNLGEGLYTVVVTDANFDPTFADKNKRSCIATDTISIDHPEPLKLTIEETNPISCNNTNTFNDIYSDGELTAHATGGIRNAEDLPYTYIWKKEKAGGGYQIIEDRFGDSLNDSILRDISVGTYYVNIIDANGITIGEAINNVVVNPQDVSYYIAQPDPIEITFESGNIACKGGNEGWAQATITGGTGSFQLKWSNGKTVDRIENLNAGTYLLFATDEKGCEATAEIKILEPEALAIEVSRQKNPTCNNGGDGAIAIQVTGGEGMYTYQWAEESLANETTNTPSALDVSSVNGNTIEGLIAGTYRVTITDENQCQVTQEFTLTNPSPNLINLGEDRLLCGGQPLLLDATFAEEGTTYEWTSDNGFTSTSPIIEITEAGTYTVALTTPLGCSGGDSVIVTTSGTEIDAHFVVSTQAFAGEEVALINISSPLGDLVEWYFPPEAEVVVQTDEDVVLLFEEPGAYDIILRSNQGDCYIDYMKSIIVEEAADIADIGDAENPFITGFKIYPNPSDGNFKVDVELTEASDISLKLFSMATQGLLNQREEGAGTEFSLDYGVALASGSYVLLLETAKASEIRKVLIK